MDKIDKNKEMCNCGHPFSKHRRGGRCLKCACKDFSAEPHAAHCRCEVCLWNRLLAAEEKMKKAEQSTKNAEQTILNLQTYINEELLLVVNQAGAFIERVFKVTLDELLEFKELKDAEEERMDRARDELNELAKQTDDPDRGEKEAIASEEEASEEVAGQEEPVASEVDEPTSSP